MSRQKMLAERRSDKKLAITLFLMETEMIGYQPKKDGRQKWSW